MLTVFDVETSRFLSPNYPADHPRQGRVLQVAALLLDDDFMERGNFCYFVDVDEKLEISESAYEAHGITVAKCKKYGVPMELPLMSLDRFFKLSDHTVAHNHIFDAKHIAYEDMVHFGDVRANRLDFKNKVCTMTLSRKIVTIDDKRCVSLSNVHFHLFGEKLPEVHDALFDCRNTAKILQELVKRNFIALFPPLKVLPSPENLVQVNS